MFECKHIECVSCFSYFKCIPCAYIFRPTCGETLGKDCPSTRIRHMWHHQVPEFRECGFIHSERITHVAAWDALMSQHIITLIAVFPTQAKYVEEVLGACPRTRHKGENFLRTGGRYGCPSRRTPHQSCNWLLLKPNTGRRPGLRGRASIAVASSFRSSGWSPLSMPCSFPAASCSSTGLELGLPVMVEHTTKAAAASCWLLGAGTGAGGRGDVRSRSHCRRNSAHADKEPEYEPQAERSHREWLSPHPDPTGDEGLGRPRDPSRPLVLTD